MSTTLKFFLKKESFLAFWGRGTGEIVYFGLTVLLILHNFRYAFFPDVSLIAMVNDIYKTSSFKKYERSPTKL